MLRKSKHSGCTNKQPPPPLRQAKAKAKALQNHPKARGTRWRGTQHWHTRSSYHGYGATLTNRMGIASYFIDRWSCKKGEDVQVPIRTRLDGHPGSTYASIVVWPDSTPTSATYRSQIQCMYSVATCLKKSEKNRKKSWLLGDKKYTKTPIRLDSSSWRPLHRSAAVYVAGKDLYAPWVHRVLPPSHSGSKHRRGGP